MSFASTHFESSPKLPDRRAHCRRPVRSLAYVELGDGNGGIALNVSEGGMAVQAVMSLSGDDLPAVRVQLSHSKNQIQLKGRVAWTGDLRKLAGVQFVDLNDETRNQIRAWIAIEAPESEFTETPAGPEPEPAPIPTSGTATESANILEFQNAPHPAAEAVSVPLESAKQPEPVEFVPAARKRITPANSVPPAFVPAAVPAAAEPAEAEEHAAPEPVVASPIVQPEAEKQISQIPPRKNARSATFFSASAATTSLAGPQDPVPVSDDRFGFRRTLSEPNVAVTAGSSRSPEKWKMSTWVPVFLVVALAAGWLAGHGVWHSGTPSAATDAPNTALNADEMAPTAASTPSAPAEIEVLDRSNHRWTIPIQSPTGKSYSSRSAVSESMANGAMPTEVGSSAPNSPLRSGNPAEANNVAAPSVSPAAAQTNNVLPSDAAAPRNIAPPSPLDSGPNNDLKPGELIHKVEPDYPQSALAQKVEGTVKILAVIDASGNVKSAQPLSGPQALVPAAVDAVRQWKYSPTLMGNRPIETQRQVTIVFEVTKNP